MPNKKKIVMPVVAALAFALALWLAFHDRSAELVPAAAPMRSSAQAMPPRRVALVPAINPGAPLRTPARTADPASSQS